MAYYLVQGGSTLKIMTTSGGLTSLTLPTDVVLDTAKRLRGATLGNTTVIVGSPTRNLSIDRYRNVRLLVPDPPASKVTLGTAASGSLSGTFNVKVTFIVKDEFGNLIAESNFGPVSANQAVSSQYLTVSAIPLSSQVISARRLYRTTTGPGTVYYPWLDVDGNTVTTAQDDVSDAGLATVAGPTDLGAPPKFEIIAAWKDRLWGKSEDKIDTLYYSAVGKIYAWPSTNTIPIPPTNRDTTGITGFLPRKDILGVGRRDSISRISSSGNNVFTRVTEAEGIGIWATDSCIVAHDVGYFLGNPFGIYRWTQKVENISNPKVKDWFESDTYFNRARFDQAIGMYDPKLNAYIVLLSAAGSTDLDRWIMYDIAENTWWGPHLTSAFTPTFCATLRDANDVAIAVFGASDGKLYKPTTTKTDGTATAIALDVTTNHIHANSPNILKQWLQPTIRTKIQASAATLTVTPTVGDTDASAGSAISHDMTLGNETLRRLGKGEMVKLRLQNSTNAIDTVIYGVELPFFELGNRS